MLDCVQGHSGSRCRTLRTLTPLPEQKSRYILKGHRNMIKMKIFNKTTAIKKAEDND